MSISSAKRLCTETTEFRWRAFHVSGDDEAPRAPCSRCLKIVPDKRSLSLGLSASRSVRPTSTSLPRPHCGVSSWSIVTNGLSFALSRSLSCSLALALLLSSPSSSPHPHNLGAWRASSVFAIACMCTWCTIGVRLRIEAVLRGGMLGEGGWGQRA